MNHRDTETQRNESAAATAAARDPLSERIIGLAIEIHRTIGPGLLESAYHHCLCYELNAAGIAFQREVPLPVRYKDVVLDCGYRLDIVVENQIILELKAVERLLPVHEAQLLTYLKLARVRTGLLMNFHSPVLKTGIKRMVI